MKIIRQQFCSSADFGHLWKECTALQNACLVSSMGNGIYALQSNKTATITDMDLFLQQLSLGFLVFYPSPFSRMPLLHHINPAVNPASSRSRQRSLDFSTVLQRALTDMAFCLVGCFNGLIRLHECKDLLATVWARAF